MQALVKRMLKAKGYVHSTCKGVDLHGDSRVEAQQSLCRLQVDGLQQNSLGLAVLVVIIQSSGQVQHDGGVVLVVLLQSGGVQLDGCRDLTLC